MAKESLKVGKIARAAKRKMRGITLDLKKLTKAVEQASDWILITDREGNIIYVNRAVEEISGYKKRELLGKNPKILKSGLHDHDFYKEIWSDIAGGMPFKGIFVNRRKGGEMFYLDSYITPVKDSRGKITHFINTGKDITAQKAIEKRLNYLAYYDILTALPNRTLFMDRLKNAVARAKHIKRFVAVVILDLNRFKLINDTCGAQTGDEMLRWAGRRLMETVRDGDTVARLGGDEFGIILADIAHPNDIVMLIEKIKGNLSGIFTINGYEILCGFKAGISVFPDDANDAEKLVLNADMEMSALGKGAETKYSFFTKETNLKAIEFVRLEKGLFNAVENKEFHLHYQPYYDLKKLELSGAEALLRWENAELGSVSPGRFIPVLEETGLIRETGRWVFREVCRQLREWLDRGLKPIPVAVNISPVQLSCTDYPDLLSQYMGEFGITPGLLTVEITERGLMKDPAFARKTVEKIKDLGISIAIDDFGTGFSSLSYLLNFPVDFLKIDISFVRDLVSIQKTKTIVEVIINMAGTMKVKTIAEGVETAVQAETLKQLGCDLAQGYLYRRPAPPGDLEEILKKQ